MMKGSLLFEDGRNLTHQEWDRSVVEDGELQTK